MALLYFILRNWRPVRVNRTFGKLQLFSAAYMGLSHGTNDAQKTMGIIALALMTATSSGAFSHLPGWLYFLRSSEPVAGQPLVHCRVDQGVVRLDHVRGHRRRRLAHHPDARP